jgi:hypothetical protein
VVVVIMMVVTMNNHLVVVHVLFVMTWMLRLSVNPAGRRREDEVSKAERIL